MGFWFFLVEIGLSVAVGYIAQSWKGRTGALWGLIAFLAQFLIMVLVIYSGDQHSPGLIKTDSGLIAAHIFAMAGAVITLLIVCTLPNQKRT